MIPVAIIIIGAYILFNWKKETTAKWIETKEEFPTEWKIILSERVLFYNTLSSEDKNRFEKKVHEFLVNCRITGIQVEIDTTDKLLVASSAVIPIFGFVNWKYVNIHEVLLYPASFNEKFETAGPDRQILGMVGTGYMEGKMIISKPALHHGFTNESDKKNTAIHEFVHLIDKSDGKIDGIPAMLLEKQYVIPWLDLINQKIDEIYANKSDINPYGGTNRADFFSVISEYFFEQPQLLEKKHPELYVLLEEIFDQKMNSKNFKKGKLVIGRNSPCPCNSGLKFKKCCGRVHYS